MIIWVITGGCSLCCSSRSHSRASSHSRDFDLVFRGRVVVPALVRAILVDGRARVRVVAVGESWIHHVRKSVGL